MKPAQFAHFEFCVVLLQRTNQAKLGIHDHHLSADVTRSEPLMAQLRA